MINKGQIIKVKSTGTRYLLDRIVPHKTYTHVYQFYPLAHKIDTSEKKPYIYPFGIGKKHLKQMLKMEQFIIEK